jgi:hypothetical protein
MVNWYGRGHMRLTLGAALGKLGLRGHHGPCLVWLQWETVFRFVPSCQQPVDLKEEIGKRIERPNILLPYIFPR